MDILRDGDLVECTSLLTYSNYSFWKDRMKAFLKSLDKRVWYSMINGWKALIIFSNGLEHLKPMHQWTYELEIITSGWNFKGLNHIYCSLIR